MWKKTNYSFLSGKSAVRTSSYTLEPTLFTWIRRTALKKKVGNPTEMFSIQIRKHLKTNLQNSKLILKKTISSFSEVIAIKADYAKKLLRRKLTLKTTILRTFFNKPSIPYWRQKFGAAYSWARQVQLPEGRSTLIFLSISH